MMLAMRAFRLLALLILLAGAAPAFATITLLEGSESLTVVRTFVSKPIKARVTNAMGQPVVGEWVYSPNTDKGAYEIDGCNDYSCGAFTNADGIAVLAPLKGNAVGTFGVLLFVPHSELGYGTAKLTVLPLGPLIEVALTGGEGQAAVAGAPFGKPLSLHVTRADVPVANMPVSFGYKSGPSLKFDGTEQPGYSISSLTDANGNVSSPLFSAAAGTGWGNAVIQYNIADPIEGATITGTATEKVTNAAGHTFEPVAPMWWAPEKSGWGVSIAQREDRLFPVVFTYLGGQPRWFVISGAWNRGFGTQYAGYWTSYVGAPYFAFDSAQVKASLLDEGGFGFLDADRSRAIVSFINSAVGIALTRASEQVVPFRFSNDVSRPPRGVGDLWWGGPSQSGWGVMIVEDHARLFVVWFTYDAEGKPVWFTMSDGSWTGADTWKGAIYKTTGTSIIRQEPQGVPYAATKVGDVTLQFSGNNSATFAYSLEGRAGTLQLERFEF